MGWIVKGMLAKVEFTLRYMKLTQELVVAQRNIWLAEGNLSTSREVDPQEVAALEVVYKEISGRLDVLEAEHKGMEPLGYQDALELALGYVKKALLKHPRGDLLVKYPYRKWSLLNKYNDCEIEEYYPQEPVPVDPAL